MDSPTAKPSLSSKILEKAFSGDFRALSEILRVASIDLNSVRNAEGFTPLHVAAQQGHAAIVSYLLTKGIDPNVGAAKSQTALQLAATRGNKTVVTALLEGGAEVDCPGFDGMTPLYAASLANKPEIVVLLMSEGADPLKKANTGLNSIEIAAKRGNTEVLNVYQEYGKYADVSQTTSIPARETLKLPDIEKRVVKSFFGLVGLETFAKAFSVDLFDFLQSNESRVRLFWGDHGTGKSEIGLRLSGLRTGIPSLAYSSTGARYVSATEEGLNLNAVTEAIPAQTLVYIDDADKLFDLDSGLKDSRDASLYRESLNTCIIRKNIYWILAGTFESVREGKGISQQRLEGLFGNSLAHKIDYFDWQLPSWTLQNLLRAVKQISSRRGLTYEDEALLLISEHCLTNGAVIGFDRVDQVLFRRKGGKPGKVTAQEAKQLLSRLVA